MTGSGRGPGILRPAVVAPAVVVAVAVAANILYLTGAVAADPLYQYPALSTIAGHGLLPGQNFIDPNVGYTSQALGHLGAEDWIHGHVPWWNPFEGLGQPLAGEMQSAAFFPLVLLDLAANGQVWFRLVLEVVAGLSTYALLRRLVTSYVAALSGAVLFELNGLFAWMGHAAMNPVAFAPLLLLGIEQARDPECRGLRGWPVIALAVALSLYAGFPEMAYIDALLAVVWALLRLGQARGRALRLFAARLAAGAGFGVALALPLLVAFFDFLADGYIGIHGGSTYGHQALDAAALSAQMMPYGLGPLFGFLSGDTRGVLLDFWSNTTGYVGMSLLVLGAAALVGRRERGLRLALGGWTLLSMARSYGNHDLMALFRLLPGESRTEFYRFASPSWTLALVVLAALLLDDLSRRGTWLPVAAAGTVMLEGLGYLYVKAHAVQATIALAGNHEDWLHASAFFAAGVALALVGFAALRNPAWRVRMLAGTMIVEAVALFVVPQLSAPVSASVDTAPVAYLQSHLGLSRFYTLGPIQPNYGSYWQIASADVNDLPLPRSYARFIDRRLDTNVDPGVFVGTQMVDPQGPTPSQEFVDHFSSYEAIGVAYLVLDPQMPVPRVPGQAPLPTVFLDAHARIVRLPDPAPFYSAVGGGCRVASFTEQSVQVHCRGAGDLVRREQDLPGWSASDDGHPVTVTARSGLFETVPLHPGYNSLRFSYLPPRELPAFAATAAAVLLAGAGLAWRRSTQRTIPRHSVRAPFPGAGTTIGASLRTGGVPPTSREDQARREVRPG